MSRLSALIAESCPNGVRTAALGDLGSIFGGLSGKTKADFSDGNARYVSYVNVFNNIAVDLDAPDFVHVEPTERQRVLQRGDVILTGSSETVGEVAMSSVITDEVTEALYLNSFCIGFRLDDPELLDPEFSKHLFRSGPIRRKLVRTASGVTRFNVSKAKLAAVQIPVPPLAVQREIAAVLDEFATLESRLRDELEAELDYRSRQYSHYRNELLTPKGTWRTTTIGDIAEVFDGPHATPKKTDVGPWYLSISSLTNGRMDLARSAHLGPDQYGDWTRRVAPQAGDTLFSYETRLGQAAYWDSDEPAALGRRMGLLRPRRDEVHPPFLTMAYLGSIFQALIRSKTVRGATVERIPIADMARWEISIPPLPEQQRIVDIVNSYDDVAKNVSLTLPAEILGRRKQYDYYRDRILTFEEAVA